METVRRRYAAETVRVRQRLVKTDDVGLKHSAHSELLNAGAAMNDDWDEEDAWYVVADGRFRCGISLT